MLRIFPLLSVSVAASAALQTRPTPCGCIPLPQAGDLLAGSCPLRSDSVVGEGVNVKDVKP